ncbi:MAG: radical SAM family heme chaperone HemW [Rickettsiaceae bacterium]|nr:radical SAM family heme chaperone HemW [Rickettsiaceae bacterium]
MKPISVYVHWPFCLSLCPYCDFNSHVASSIDHDLWLNSYKQEISYFKEKLSGRKIQSIFFGGGTPSLMRPKTVEGIIEVLSAIGVVSEATEITLEANPTSYETEKFKEFKSAGINRVSIGIQSLKNDALKILGRMHSKDEAISAINSASKIFSRYSFDLIYAIPNQTLEDWQNELSGAIKFANGHISLYQLTIEKGTPFYQIFKTGQMQLPCNETSANMYEWTNNFLKEQGYYNYEISNYAQQGNECLHNLAYWNYNEYLGIGPGAHSRLHNDNSINAIMMLHKPEKWLQNIEKKGHGIQTNSSLVQGELIEEIVMMGTRLKQGMSLGAFNELTGINFDNVLLKKNFSHFQKCGLVFKNNTHFGLTERGLLLHNYLIPRLIS